MFVSLLATQRIYAQEAENENKHIVTISIDRLATYIHPAWFEEEEWYPGDSSKHRRFKISYSRPISKSLHLRGSYEFYNDYQSYDNGKNWTAYGQSHRKFQVAQMAIGSGFISEKRFNPLFEIGYEFGTYSWLDDWWEKYDFNKYGPGSYRLRYHENKYRFNILGITANVGFRVQINKHLFLTTTFGYRRWLGFPKDHEEELMFVPNFSQSNIIQLGYRF